MRLYAYGQNYKLGPAGRFGTGLPHALITAAVAGQIDAERAE